MISCKDKTHNNDTEKVITFKGWSDNAIGYSHKNCGSSSYAQFFTKVVEERNILEQVEIIVNELLYTDSIERVVISGDVFGIGRIRVTIITKSDTFYLFYSDSQNCKIYFVNKTTNNLSYERIIGCNVNDEDKQMIAISTRVNNDSIPEVLGIHFFSSP